MAAASDTTQTPQLFRWVRRLTHWPAQQVSPNLHVLLQLTQCWLLYSVSTHMPLQHVFPGLRPGTRTGASSGTRSTTAAIICRKRRLLVMVGGVAAAFLMVSCERKWGTSAYTLMGRRNMHAYHGEQPNSWVYSCF
jgi:hypothetical protein